VADGQEKGFGVTVGGQLQLRKRSCLYSGGSAAQKYSLRRIRSSFASFIYLDGMPACSLRLRPSLGRRNYLCRRVFDLETKGDWMKKIFAIAFTVLLTAGLALAQASADTKKKTEKKKKKTEPATPADKVALNPQPLPPKERKAGGDPASKV